MRRVALVPMILLGGCQALLVLDDGGANVVDGPDADAASVDSTNAPDGGVTNDAPPADVGIASADPCRPADQGSSFVFCDAFDRSDGSFPGWMWGSANNWLGLESSTLHVHTVDAGEQAVLGYQFNIGKPVEFHVEYDFRLASLAYGMAISQLGFGPYLVRVVVDEQKRFGFDEFDGNSTPAETRHLPIDPRVPIANDLRWWHVALDLATDASTLKHAKLTIDGAMLVEADLQPTDSSTEPVRFEFGAVDRAIADMHFDNVRITRTP